MPSGCLKAPEAACEYTCLQRFHHLRSGNPFFRQPRRSSRPFQDPLRRRLGLLYGLHLRLRDMFPETYASTAGRAGNTRIDQLDPRVLQCRNQLHQRVDVPTDDTVARFHALNGRHGKIRQICRLPLIYVQERTGGPELVGRNHEMAASGEIRIEYIYTVRITVSSINLDAKYISPNSGRCSRLRHLRLVPNFPARCANINTQYLKKLAPHT